MEGAVKSWLDYFGTFQKRNSKLKTSFETLVFKSFQKCQETPIRARDISTFLPEKADEDQNSIMATTHF